MSYTTNNNSSSGISPALFPGLELTISTTDPANTPYNNIRFSWYSGSAFEAFAGSTLYILNTAYTGAPNALSSVSSSEVVGTGTPNSSNTAYNFSSNVTLTNGTTYYFYTAGSSNSDTGTFAWFNDSSGGTGNFAQGDAGSYFVDSADYTDYSLQSVPEPATLSLAATAGIAGLGWLRVSRWRKNRAFRSAA